MAARGGSSRFAREARTALEQSLRTALRLGDRHIGTDHLLLGLLDQPSFLAVRLLDRLGVDVPALRRTLVGDRDRRAG